MKQTLIRAGSGLLVIGLLAVFGLLVVNRSPPFVATGQASVPPAQDTQVCLNATEQRVRVDWYGYVHHEDGSTDVTIGVTNWRLRKLDAIGIQARGWRRVAPADRSTYTGTLGDYQVRWVTLDHTPQQEAFRFRTQGSRFRVGAQDQFTVTITAFDSTRPITVWVEVGNQWIEAQGRLTDPACDQTPPVPTPTTTPTATPPVSPLPTPTPDPDQGLRVLPQRDVTLGPNEEGKPYTGFIPLRMEGEQLVGRGSTGTESHLVSVDLNTGQVERLSEVNIAGVDVVYGDLAIRAGYVEYPYNASIEIINVVSGEKQVFALGIPRIGSMSFQDGLAAWTTTNDRKTESPGLYGYLLESGELFPVQLDEPDRFTGKPNVCNAEWIAYQVASVDPRYADTYPRTVHMYHHEVWAYHYPTGDKIHLGMTHDFGGLEAYGIRCDKNHLIWLERAADAAPTETGYQLWHFDLSTRTRHVMADGVRGASSELRIYDDILWNWDMVYDLRTGAIIEAHPPSTGGQSYSSFLVNDAFVRVIDETPRRLAIVQLERATP